ncbi:MAG: hypothetical protein HC846_02160 [Blastocatellia bacterium]|nr:hypothetical protein [Blastocatellia bacterium]
MDEARKAAVANEIATLAVEVARQTAASQAAATKLAEITVATSTKYKDPTKTDWDIPFDKPQTGTELVPTGGTRSEPEQPSEEPKSTPPLPTPPKPPFDLEKILEAIRAKLGPLIGFKITLSTGIIADVIVNMLRGTDNQPSSNDQQRLNDLANHRTSRDLPASTYEGDTGTVASITVENGDEPAYGYNTSLERDYLNVDTSELRKELFQELINKGALPQDTRYNDRYGGLFLTHAETEALIKAKQKYGNLEGKDLKIPCVQL